MDAINKITERVKVDYKKIEQDIENVHWINRLEIDQINLRIQKLESIIDKAIEEFNRSKMPIEELKDKTIWLRWYQSSIQELKAKLEKKDFLKWFFQLSSVKQYRK
ncbi:MAG: hypothetical protein KME54_26500 [Tolypothrix brevis GSE-NOS-MK-07-07A]|jgi:FtsZ-binding cell division protein ZapB|nr:hypothetical protein [Tolypothrix brevis GSE-NOS-MK-07-07A]